MKLLVHCGRIGPSSRIEIHFALPGHVQEVNDQYIQRQVPVAVSLRDIQDLLLRWIDCLALNVTVCGLWQQVSDARQLAVTLVDFVALFPRNHKK